MYECRHNCEVLEVARIKAQQDKAGEIYKLQSSIQHHITELVLCLRSDNPNLEMALRRAEQIRQLVEC